MTAPRTGLFQRKGGPSAPSGGVQTSNSAKGGPGDLVSDPAPDTPGQDGDDAGSMVTCPECGCQFDPTQDTPGTTSGPPMDPTAGMSGDDSGLGAKIAAMMQGGAGA